MTKIINNRKYDTDTARKVGYWDNGEYGGLHFCEETLYRKRTGEYFLFGCGGAGSKYAKNTGDNSWSSGEEIIPITWETAREWAEEHLKVEEYEAEFGEVSDDGSKIIKTVSLSESVVKLANRAAAQAGISLSEYIEKALVSYLESSEAFSR